MNREEAVRKLEYSKTAYQMLIDEKVDSGKLVGKNVKGEWKADTPLDEAYKSMIDALEMGIKAIKALEQQPCEDAVSREWLKIAIHNFYHGLKHTPTEEDIQAYIDAAPPVNPTKTGHWIDDNENEIDAQYGRHLYKCSKCNEYADMFIGGTEDWWDLEKPNYCPNCGCRMVEPQESERTL